jgi:hypothetical protein
VNAKELRVKTEEGPARVPGTDTLKARTQARRRLLRGSFAAPAVLSLSSGSVFAYSVNCLAKAPQSVDVPTSGPFSVERYSVKINNTWYKVVKAADISSKATIHGYQAANFVSGKTWINVATGSDLTMPTGIRPNKDSYRFVALRFKNIGSDLQPVYGVTGLGQSTSVTSGEGNIMYESCWNSIKPRP